MFISLGFTPSRSTYFVTLLAVSVNLVENRSRYEVLTSTMLRNRRHCVMPISLYLLLALPGGGNRFCHVLQSIALMQLLSHGINVVCPNC